MKIEVVASSVIIVQTLDGERYRIQDRDNGQIGITTDGLVLMEVQTRGTNGVLRTMGHGNDLVIDKG